jgi:hypothetical protein
LQSSGNVYPLDNNSLAIHTLMQCVINIPNIKGAPHNFGDSPYLFIYYLFSPIKQRPMAPGPEWEPMLGLT